MNARTYRSRDPVSPLQEFNRDSRPLTYLDASVVAEAFLHHEKRRVDKGTCISFRGRRYEALPISIQACPPVSSRFLDALEKKHGQSREKMADAISFASYKEGVAKDV